MKTKLTLRTLIIFSLLGFTSLGTAAQIIDGEFLTEAKREKPFPAPDHDSRSYSTPIALSDPENKLDDKTEDVVIPDYKPDNDIIPILSHIVEAGIDTDYVKVFPIPATSYLNIDLWSLGDVKVKLLSMAGGLAVDPQFREDVSAQNIDLRLGKAECIYRR